MVWHAHSYYTVPMLGITTFLNNSQLKHYITHMKHLLYRTHHFYAIHRIHINNVDIYHMLIATSTQP